MFACAPSSAAVTGDGSNLVPGARRPRITSLRLGLLTAQEVEATAGAVLTDHTVYTKNLPKLGGPHDPGMGPSDRRVLCNTCRSTWFKCPGHTGVLRLPVPMYHVQFMDMTFKLLQIVCWVCSKLLATPVVPDTLVDTPMARFAAAFECGRGRFYCPHCKCPQPKYKRVSEMCLRREWTPHKLAELGRLSPGLALVAERVFTPADALDIFANMGPDTILAVGMDPDRARPEALILQNLSVLPPNARPAIMAAEGSKRRGQDDITSQLQDIIKAVVALQRAMCGGAKKLPNPCPEFDYVPPGALQPPSGAAVPAAWTSADVLALRAVLGGTAAAVTPEQAAAVWTTHPQLCERLQNDVTVMINNGGRYAPLARQRTGVPKRSLVARLMGKQGRLRCNIFARRTDQNARSVIKPDRLLDVDQLGVPFVFMNTLTKPEEVHRGNLRRLQGAVDRGPGVWGGAARVLRSSGQLIQLHLMKPGMARVQLRVGDVVERHLRNGDMGIFNRQPTLHRLSFMAHRLVGVPGKAFCLPLATMTPYNADCDGDEMNLHILQSPMADAEARMLLAVSANVMNPQTNAPCLSLVQDTRVGAMLLTRRTTVLDRETMDRCVAAIAYKVRGKETVPPPAGTDAAGAPYWTGKQLVSLLLPQGLFLERRVRGAGPEVGPEDPDERLVVVWDGMLLHGSLCKGTLGTGGGGLVHRIRVLGGAEAAVHFLSDLQRVVYTWLPTRGLTMGLLDCMTPIAAALDTRAAIQDADTVVEALTRRAADLAGALTRAESLMLEAHVLTILTSVLDFASRRVLAETTAVSGLRDMVASGSKGNTNNVAMVMSNLGQQVIEGERVAPSAVSGRTLPCFPAGAFSAAARGFVTHSYLDGMSPPEYFFHMMAGREGLVATAVKTADTGYKYRSMAAAMGTNVVAWDGTVRNAQNYVLEFVAGGDCLDPCHVERVDLGPALRASRAAVARQLPGASPQALARVLADQAFLRAGLFTPCYPEGVTRVLLPCNPQEELHALGHAIAMGRVRPVVHPIVAAVAAAAAAAAAATEAGAGADAETAAAAAAAADVGALHTELAQAVQDLCDRLTAVLPVPEAGAALRLALAWDLAPVPLLRAGVTCAAALHATIGATVTRRLMCALVAPGDSVGVVAAQSIGEPSTQFTLNVFHHAGLLQRHLTVGVPRLKELLHGTVTIRTPTMTAPLRARMEPAAAARAARSLQFLCLDTAIHSSYVVLDPVFGGAGGAGGAGGDAGALRHDLPTTVYKDLELMQHVLGVFGPEPADASPWIIRFTLNRSLLTEQGFTPEMVARAIAAQLPSDPAVCTNVSIVYSEPNMQRWVVRVRTRGDTSERAARVLHGSLRDSVLLGGIRGVRSARVIEVPGTALCPDTGALVPTTAQAVDMEGSSLLALATRDWVQWEAVTTNDVMEVASVLGLAAARAVLFAELDRIVSYDGGYVDARHLAQIVTTMTHRGFVMAMTRHGINRVDLSVLQRTSFEEPVDMLLQGAAQGVSDPLRGVCECIYVGAKPPIGTGTVGVMEDVEGEGAGQAPRVMVLSEEGLEILLGASAYTGKWAAFMLRTMTAIAKEIPSTVPTVAHLFRALHSVMFLASGCFGITISCYVRSLALPLVVKFTSQFEWAGPLRGLPCVYCINDGAVQRGFMWSGATDSRREVASTKAAMQLALGSHSPHFLKVYYSSEKKLEKPTTLAAVLAQIGKRVQDTDINADDAKLPQSRLLVTACEYGGIPLKTILGEYLYKLGDPARFRQHIASLTFQVTQAIAAMHANSMHHNDLHMGNVVGCPTRDEYLYYILDVEEQAGPRGKDSEYHSYLFRVPTLGIIWRVLDFGMATSTEEHGPLDHGIESCFGNSHKASAFMQGDVPVQLFDAGRFLSDLFLTLQESQRRIALPPSLEVQYLLQFAVQAGKRQGSMRVEQCRGLHFPLPAQARSLYQAGRSAYTDPKTGPAMEHLSATALRTVKALAEANEDTGLVAALLVECGRQWKYETQHVPDNVILAPTVLSDKGRCACSMCSRKAGTKAGAASGATAGAKASNQLTHVPLYNIALSPRQFVDPDAAETKALRQQAADFIRRKHKL